MEYFANFAKENVEQSSFETTFKELIKENKTIDDVLINSLIILQAHRLYDLH